MRLDEGHRLPKRKPREKSIGNGLKLTNDQVSIENPSALERDPALALRVYDEAVRRDLPVYAFARDAIVRAISYPLRAFRSKPHSVSSCSNARFRSITHAARSVLWGARAIALAMPGDFDISVHRRRG